MIGPACCVRRHSEPLGVLGFAEKEDYLKTDNFLLRWSDAGGCPARARLLRFYSEKINSNHEFRSNLKRDKIFSSVCPI